MMSRCIMGINLIVLVFEISQAPVVEDCTTNCTCCASAPNGSRLLSDICLLGNNVCKYGCKDGYYAERCYKMCPEYCTRCARKFSTSGLNDYKKCYLCADGYYNGTGVTDCSTSCPVNCANNICDKTTGHCLNGCTSYKRTGNKCDGCVSGYYGGQCEPCPDKCKDDICDVSDGSCTYGCKDSRFTGAQCDQCQTGKYGENCDKSCPENCLSDVCDRTDGSCIYGCTGNFDGRVANDNVNVGAIIGGVVGGLSIVIIILDLYIIHLRRGVSGSNENITTEQDNGAEMEEHHTYEGLGGETRDEKSVYSDLRSDVDYVNTKI